MPTLKGWCPGCGKEINAFVGNEDLRPVGEEGFAAYFGIADVTCKCGKRLGEPEDSDGGSRE